MSQVFERSNAAGSARLVLLALADNADDAGECWPRIQTLADKTKLSRATVSRMLRKLEELGEVRTEERTGADGRRLANLYLITLPEPQPDAPPCQSAIPPHVNGDMAPMSTVTWANNEPSREPSEETHTPLPPALSKTDHLLAHFLERKPGRTPARNQRHAWEDGWIQPLNDMLGAVADDVPAARQRLDQALDYMDAQGLTVARPSSAWVVYRDRPWERQRDGPKVNGHKAVVIDPTMPQGNEGGTW